MQHALDALKEAVKEAEQGAIYASTHGLHEEAWAYIDKAKELADAYNILAAKGSK